MKRSLLLLTALMVLSSSSVLRADNIVYYVDQTIGAGSVVGTITTDGTLGTLAQGNIVNWSLTLNDGVNAFDLFGPLSGAANSQFTLVGSDLNGSAEDLSFDFRADVGYFLFRNPFSADPFAFNNVWCGSDQSFDCYAGHSGESLFVAPGDQIPSLALNFRTVIGTVTAPGDAPEPSTALLMLTGVALPVGLRKRIASSRRKL